MATVHEGKHSSGTLIYFYPIYDISKYTTITPFAVAINTGLKVPLKNLVLPFIYVKLLGYLTHSSCVLSN